MVLLAYFRIMIYLCAINRLCYEEKQQTNNLFG